MSGGHLCEAEAPSEPAGETAVRCAAIRSLLKEELRILSCSALRMTYRLAIATIVECAASRRLVIAKVRVSGGHLCKAEAPTEPAGEICKRLWQSVFLFKDITDSFALTTLAAPKSCYLLGARTTFHRGVRRCSLFPALQRKQRHSE